MIFSGCRSLVAMENNQFLCSDTKIDVRQDFYFFYKTKNKEKIYGFYVEQNLTG
jgi:hypothetical protein